MEEKRVAVMAGTPVDTRMGVEYIQNKNSGQEGLRLLPLYVPVAEDCDAQLRFQYSDEDGKRAVMDHLFDEEIAKGTRDFFIYCNSLSGAFDFDSYAVMKSLDTGEDIHIYTPLQVYRSLGKDYSCLGVMAANNLSAHGIEEALLSSNQDIYMIGTGNMAIVRAIEDGLGPDEIAEKCGLSRLAGYMEACGAEAIVLGCTHFPYFREELEKLCSVPVIDPAEKMYESLVRGMI